MRLLINFLVSFNNIKKRIDWKVNSRKGDNMRKENSIKNITIGVMSQLVIAILGFISRKVFLDNLNVAYLGINGLLTNVLSLLGLVEAGIGGSIVYNLYKPLAEDNKPKVAALIQLYKKAYRILALVILVLSIGLYPIIRGMVAGEELIENFNIVYSIFILKNILAYLYSHKWCIINADQKNYILTRVNLLFNIIVAIVKIGILIITKSYILFLLIETILIIGESIYKARIVDRLYPYINTIKNSYLDNDTKENIIKNVKALFLHNIGGFFVFGTDNLLITKFVGVGAVGIYSNYSMIINQLVNIIVPILNGVGASIGNLIATESKEKNYTIFKVTYLVNFWIYSVCVIFLFNLLNPFIKWWIGREYLLDTFTLVIILLNCYITGIRNSIGTFKSKAGIFVEDKYFPLIESAINLVASIILVKYLGLVGIFIGTTISTLSTVFWNIPRLTYKYVFDKPVINYFKKYVFYLILTTICTVITMGLCNLLVKGEGFISLILRGIISLTVPNIIYILIFFKTKEFQYLLDSSKKILCKFNLFSLKNINKNKVLSK